MEERVSWLGGQLNLKSQRGKGSRVSDEVPLDISSHEKWA
jgi:signal transduction histidine kinase